MSVQAMGAAGRACMRQTSLTQPGGNRSDSPRSGAALPNRYGVLGDGERTEMLGGGRVQSGESHVARRDLGVIESNHVACDGGATLGCETNPYTHRRWRLQTTSSTLKRSVQNVEKLEEANRGRSLR